ncbi:hypothetical protein HPQ64_08345 [Rhizobiales bacterium]|uniref:hypothetical protein n=1 Tax=Hongsoonwoonella zoysiae TaxID=2821844 RepID=UPI0015608BE8|nr:hypothetical protein [Hongsoonwoonella zoysiae]NRG17696.1 hypothetical protein [Hongsoonwoonella zoysiae]
MNSQIQRNDFHVGADSPRTGRHLSIAIALGLGLALAIALFGQSLSGASGGAESGSSPTETGTPVGAAVSDLPETAAPPIAPKSEARPIAVRKFQRRHPVIREAARQQEKGSADTPLDHQRMTFLQ